MKKCIYSLDAGGSFLKCGLVDEKRRVIPGTHDSEPVDSASGSISDIRAAYAALAARARAHADALGCELVAAGMDTPGPFDYTSGCFRMTHKYRVLYGVSVLPWFAEDLPGLPVSIIHDSTAFILGASASLPEEKRKRGCVAAVMLGTGLGFALMRDSEPLLRSDDGPMISLYRHPLRGTEAEELISARGIVRRYTALSEVSAPIGAKEVAALARSGDTAAAHVYAETGSMLGELLSPIIAEHRVHTLLLGGQISRDAELFLPALKHTLSDAQSADGSDSDIEIVRASNVDDAHLLGAAEPMQRLCK